ncbi:hypothetical protein CPAR01_09870 [Colletotrichum paranaense]|uniref:Uncharacterized protein n=3 Tax=Colletotrichum acutatum species complex TaxID=2707335 RepID=A0AAI9YJ61_9PEZI|nr:uncharacterized protein CCOS01_14207 [Colletotrichum costaricense]XP_060346316.1 uncharacterized protein CPAR01_09870 [Colletotrichum paranaense]KAK0376263.1 hypothetical protein CLIM01_06389 [Colletotrichum limetticola]KAK1513265.1 hypothetical protein CCOS01_14207 [Colletotrichum costaricense]KAK1533162.1 hypothetical protein CPAR01_09870 [Colletotrichum paranaense]
MSLSPLWVLGVASATGSVSAPAPTRISVTTIGRTRGEQHSRARFVVAPAVQGYQKGNCSTFAKRSSDRLGNSQDYPEIVGGPAGGEMAPWAGGNGCGDLVNSVMGGWKSDQV